MTMAVWFVLSLLFPLTVGASTTLYTYLQTSTSPPYTVPMTETTTTFAPIGTVNSNIAQGNELQLTVNPSEIVLGVTPDLTLHCTPGLKDDLSIIMLLQISHLLNGTRTLIADVTPSGTRVSHVQYTNAKVTGNIPRYGVVGAFLTVAVSRPGVTDGGQYECSLSGLDSMELLTSKSVTTVVSVLDLNEISSQIRELRQEVSEGARKYEQLEEEVRKLETARGVAFAAFLSIDVDASRGRLLFDMETVDTRDSFASGAYIVPEAGNYLLVLQIAVKAGGHITADLRHDGRPLGRVIAYGWYEDGQASTSVIALLRQGEIIDVEVVQHYNSTRLLSSQATFLSGRML